MYINSYCESGYDMKCNNLSIGNNTGSSITLFSGNSITENASETYIPLTFKSKAFKFVGTSGSSKFSYDPGFFF